MQILANIKATIFILKATFDFSGTLISHSSRHYTYYPLLQCHHHHTSSFSLKTSKNQTSFGPAKHSLPSAGKPLKFVVFKMQDSPSPHPPPPPCSVSPVHPVATESPCQ